MEFIRHKNLFPEHLFLNALAVTSMMNFYNTSKTSIAPLNVQEQPFTIVVHKIVLKNFTDFTAKDLYWTFYFDKFASSRPAT